MNVHISYAGHLNKLSASDRQNRLICSWYKSKNLSKTFQCLIQHSTKK